MKRLSWTVLIAAAIVLTAFGCAGAPGPEEFEEIVEVGSIDGDEEIGVDPVDPVDSGEAGGVLEVGTLLPIGGVLSGDLNFEPVDDTGVGFTSPFTLQIVPLDFNLIDQAFFAMLEGMEFPAEVDPVFDVAVILSQPRGDGTTQDTYGRAGLLPDGAIRAITVGGDDNFLETFVLDFEPPPLDAFDGWTFVPVTGANVGVDRETTLEEAIDLAIDFLAKNDRSGDFLWGFRVSGEMTSGAPEETAAGDSEIADVNSGTYEGEAWIKMDLFGGIVAGEERKRYGVEFRTNDGDHIVAAYNVEPNGDIFSTSFCVGDETPSCPGGVFPIVGELGDDGMSLVFFYNVDAWDNATNPTYSAFVETGPADFPEDRTTVLFNGGERLPVRMDERDPC